MKRRLFYIGTAVISVCVAVFFYILASTVRVLVDPLPRPAVRIEGDMCCTFDEAVGVVPLPNVSYRWSNASTGVSFSVRTDETGARVDARPSTEERRPPDAVVIGGFFAFGQGVESEATFAGVPAERLGVRIANLAYPGYGTVQALRALQKHRRPAPRAIVYGFIEDHLSRNLCPCRPTGTPFCTPTPYVEFGKDGSASIRPPPLRRYRADLVEKYHRDLVNRDSPGLLAVWWRMRLDFLSLQAGPPCPDDAAARSAAFAAVMGEMAETARAVNAALLVVNIPIWSPQTPRMRRSHSHGRRNPWATAPFGSTWPRVSRIITMIQMPSPC